MVDAGNSTCKFGYAGDDFPKAVFPGVSCEQIMDELVYLHLITSRSCNESPLLDTNNWQQLDDFI